MNKLAILGDEAPGRQGAKTTACLDIPSFRTGSRTGSVGVQNVTLFLSESFVQRRDVFTVPAGVRRR